MKRESAQKALNTSYYVFSCLVVMESLRLINSVGVYGVLDQMSKELGISLTQAQTELVSPFLMGLLFGQFLIGPLSDRFGRINVFIIFLNIYAITSLVCAFDTEPVFLQVFRFLSGFTAAIGEISVRAILSDFCSLKSGAKLFSKISGTAGLIRGIAPLSLNIAAQYLGWRSYFIINAIICCMVSAVSSYLIFTLGSKRDKNALSYTNIKLNIYYTIGSLPYVRFAIFFLMSMLAYESVFVLSPIMLLEKFHVSEFDYTLIVGVVIGIVLFLSANLNSYVLKSVTPVTVSLYAMLVALTCSTIQAGLFAITNDHSQYIAYIFSFCALVGSLQVINLNLFVLATQSAPGKVSGGFVSSLTISIGTVGLLVGVNFMSYFGLQNIISAYVDIMLFITLLTIAFLYNFTSMLRDQKQVMSSK